MAFMRGECKWPWRPARDGGSASIFYAKRLSQKPRTSAELASGGRATHAHESFGRDAGLRALI